MPPDLKLRNGDSYFRRQAARAGVDVPRYVSARWWATSGSPDEAWARPLSKRPAKAQVNWGRWIVECPAGCNGAQLAYRQTPMFVCVDCGQGPYRVIWPGKPDQIEARLIARERRNQHWQGESLEDLDRENARHGVNPLTGPR